VNNQLRGDEEFVIGAIANFFSATWRAGENPPDAYLKVEDRDVAVEISTLMQHQSDGRGGTRSRMSDDAPALRLVDELNEKLEGELPYGCSVILSLRTPILSKRLLKPKLKETILDLVSRGSIQTAQENILDNRIEVTLRRNDAPGHVCGVVSRSALPQYDILTETSCILEERIIVKEQIIVKARKSNRLPFEGPLWLALLDRYPLAKIETYQRAMKKIAVDHHFVKILLVSRDRSVAVLFENSQ